MNEQNTLVQEKWMAAAAWLGMLIALLVTSFQALSVVANSGISQLILSYIQNRASLEQANLANYPLIAGVLIILAAAVLVYAWLRFAHLTNEVMIALSSPRDDSEPVFSSFLDLTTSSEQAEGGSDATVYEAKGSLFGDMIRLLAIVWVILLIISPIISIG
jgi:hypothetical protein